MLKNIGSLSWCETEHINEKGKKVYKVLLLLKTRLTLLRSSLIAIYE